MNPSSWMAFEKEKKWSLCSGIPENEWGGGKVGVVGKGKQYDKRTSSHKKERKRRRNTVSLSPSHKKKPNPQTRFNALRKSPLPFSREKENSWSKGQRRTEREREGGGGERLVFRRGEKTCAKFCRPTPRGEGGVSRQGKKKRKAT